MVGAPSRAGAGGRTDNPPATREEWLKKRIDDLFHRQIDTIVTDQIYAGAVDPVRALQDISHSYDSWLSEVVPQHRETDAGHEADRPREHGLLEAGVFEALATRAENALKKGPRLGRQDGKLRYIADTSRELARIVTAMRAEPGRTDLEYEDRAVIEKAWEIRESPIAIHTKVWIDGDVVTRVASQYASDSGAAIREVHKDALETSQRTWDLLVRTVGSMARALFDASRGH